MKASNLDPIVTVFYPNGGKRAAIEQARQFSALFASFIVIDDGCVWVFPDIFA